MDCPTCGGDCVVQAEKVLERIFQMYAACRSCPPDPLFNKRAPFIENIDSSTGRCIICGKRHIDFVIGNVLNIMKEGGIFQGDASLREVGTPLIAFGYQVPYPPRLGKKSLVLVMDEVTEDVAGRITADVPEIKGVIKRKGAQSRCIGILDIESKPHLYNLLSGCDMRCDLVSSIFGELCIYKNQSLIHIEFNNTKISKIEELYIKGELHKAVVVDGFCGPGTLGLLSALGGAKKVILNDAWLPAIRNTIMNINVNSGILGVKMSYQSDDINKFIGDEPVLMAEADGRVEIQVYHGDVRKLYKAVDECDIFLIDTFPSVNPADYLSANRSTGKTIVI